MRERPRKSKSMPACLFTQSCPTLCDRTVCSPPGSSVHGISQARVLEWVAIPFSRRSSPPRDQTQVSCIAGRFFTIWATILHAKSTFKNLYGTSGLHLACKNLRRASFILYDTNNKTEQNRIHNFLDLIIKLRSQGNQLIYYLRKPRHFQE